MAVSNAKLTDNPVGVIHKRDFFFCNISTSNLHTTCFLFVFVFFLVFSWRWLCWAGKTGGKACSVSIATCRLYSLVLIQFARIKTRLKQSWLSLIGNWKLKVVFKNTEHTSSIWTSMWDCKETSYCTLLSDFLFNSGHTHCFSQLHCLQMFVQRLSVCAWLCVGVC